MNEMKEPSETSFKLERAKINEIISKEGQFNEDDVIIKKWEGDNAFGYYLAQISKEETQFTGILNNNLERDGYGFYRSQNGDHYFGMFKNDERNINGFYIWPPTQDGDKVHSESYHGFWKDNKKNKYGVYLWLDEDEDNEEFDNANFEAFSGEIDGNSFKRGTFLRKNGDNYYVYHGNFTPDGKKNDEKAFFYSSTLDRLFHGKIENNAFISGYIVYFDSDSGEVQDYAFCEFENNEVKKTVIKEDMNEEEVKPELDENILFRNVILGIDYFGAIYNTYKDTLKFIKENLGDLEIFENQEIFPDLMKAAVAYNKENIYFDIEDKVFGNKV